MTAADAILVRALSDALRLPVRAWQGSAGSERWYGLRELASRGVPYRVNAGGDEAARKGGERALLALADGGLLAVRRSAAKFHHARRTTAGEARARGLCGLPDRAAGRLILGAVAEQTDRVPRTEDRLWLSEVVLNGGRGWGEATAAGGCR